MRKVLLTVSLLAAMTSCVGNKQKANSESIDSCEVEDVKKYTEVAELTAYYAKVDVKDFMWELKKGQLIVDTNNPIDRIVEESDTEWKFEGDNTGEYYSSIIPKSKVEVRKYMMCELPVSEINDGATFVSKRGLKARIFWANINGHKYYNWDGTEEDYKATQMYKECYVLSAQVYSPYDESGARLFEEQLQEERGNIKLYVDETNYNEGCSKDDVRYRGHKIGHIEDVWWAGDEWDYQKSSFSSDGKMLVDQYDAGGIPEEVSIAFIPSENALYINGDLYFRK